MARQLPENIKLAYVMYQSMLAELEKIAATVLQKALTPEQLAKWQAYQASAGAAPAAGEGWMTPRETVRSFRPEQAGAQKMMQDLPLIGTPSTDIYAEGVPGLQAATTDLRRQQMIQRGAPLHEVQHAQVPHTGGTTKTWGFEGMRGPAEQVTARDMEAAVNAGITRRNTLVQRMKATGRLHHGGPTQAEWASLSQPSAPQAAVHTGPARVTSELSMGRTVAPAAPHAMTQPGTQTRQALTQPGTQVRQAVTQPGTVKPGRPLPASQFTLDPRGTLMKPTPTPIAPLAKKVSLPAAPKPGVLGRAGTTIKSFGKKLLRAAA